MNERLSRVDPSAFNILSVCTGGGGLDLGVKLACRNARVVCCVEHEAYACEILATRMEEGLLDDAPVWTDLRTFNGEPWRGVVDCVIGGYPCQPFSRAGRRRGERDPRNLWPYISELLRHIRPSTAFFENVSGHLRLGFEKVHKDLGDMGYRVAAGLFAAQEVGAPHERVRLFILAHSDKHEWRENDERGGHRGEGKNSEWQAQSAIGCGRLELEYPEDSGFQNGGGEELPDTHVEGLEERESLGGDPQSRRETAQRGGRELADAKGDDGRAEYGAGREGVRWPGPSEGRHELGDPEILRWREALGWQQEVLGPFPPGRSDFDGWRRVLEAEPRLKPALRRVADGMAPWVDRLRLCGLGVVPVVAAYAFITLADALGVVSRSTPRRVGTTS